MKLSHNVLVKCISVIKHFIFENKLSVSLLTVSVSMKHIQDLIVILVNSFTHAIFSAFHAVFFSPLSAEAAAKRLRCWVICSMPQILNAAVGSVDGEFVCVWLCH